MENTILGITILILFFIAFVIIPYLIEREIFEKEKKNER